MDSAGDVGDEFAMVAAAWAAIAPEGRRAIVGAVRAFTMPTPDGSPQGTQSPRPRKGRMNSTLTAGTIPSELPKTR